MKFYNFTWAVSTGSKFVANSIVSRSFGKSESKLRLRAQQARDNERIAKFTYHPSSYDARDRRMVRAEPRYSQTFDYYTFPSFCQLRDLPAYEPFFAGPESDQISTTDKVIWLFAGDAVSRSRFFKDRLPF